MNTNYFKRMRKIFDVPIPELREYWNRAEKLALSHPSQDQTVLANAIFYNLVSQSATAIPAWWSRLSKEEKQEYLDQHPGSHLTLTDDPDEKAPAWWLKLSEKEQKDYLEENPDSELKVSSDDHKTLKGLANRAWQKKRARAAATLSHHKTGLHSLKKLFSGGTISRAERSQAKATAVLTAKLVLGALAGIALFTVLAPVAPIVAGVWLDTAGASSSESSEANEDTQRLALDTVDAFQTWLINQDLNALTEHVTNSVTK